jgi:DUF1009 family protein
MSASKESSIKKLGIIAGGGGLPEKLIHSCDTQGIHSFIVSLEDQVNPNILKGREYMISSIGKAGTIITTLKSRNIRDIVLIGSVKRPALKELRPDMKTAAFLAKLGFSAMGDNSLLSAIKKELEHEGFKIHGIQKFAQDLLADKSFSGKYKPSKQDEETILKGIQVSQAIGRMDIGQSVVVQQGTVLGVEAAEGTESLIKRCALIQKKGRGAILVKTCKPQQDKSLDLPTIGPDTVLQCARAGFSGIIIHAENSLLFNPDEIIQLANQYKLFIKAIEIEESNE